MVTILRLVLQTGQVRDGQPGGLSLLGLLGLLILLGLLRRGVLGGRRGRVRSLLLLRLLRCLVSLVRLGSLAGAVLRAALELLGGGRGDLALEHGQLPLDVAAGAHHVQLGLDVIAMAAHGVVERAGGHQPSTILSQSVKGQVADDLLAKGIAEVRQKLN